MRIIVAVFISLFVSAAGLIGGSYVYAQSATDSLCEGADLSLSKPSGSSCDKDACKQRDSSGKCTQRESESNLNKLITSIVNIFSVVVGIVAVIMIIFSGFKYITSSGDSGNISAAKNTIIYAIVGLIIVALAQGIVRFVLDKV